MEIKDVLKHEDFVFALCTFLDKFKLSEKKECLLKIEPEDISNKERKCILAAVAHKLSNDNNLKPPDWVMKKEYIMDKPLYSNYTTDEEYQDYLKSVAPFEFASRNIYFEKNAISRV